MSAILTTKLAGNVGGGTFDYGFLDASGIGNGPFYAATAAVNASTQLINPATLESIEALQAAITAGITVSFAGQTIAVSALPLPPGASSSANQATANTLLGQIVSLLQQTAAETLWTDNTGAFFIRVGQPHRRRADLEGRQRSRLGRPRCRREAGRRPHGAGHRQDGLPGDRRLRADDRRQRFHRSFRHDRQRHRRDRRPVLAELDPGHDPRRRAGDVEPHRALAAAAGRRDACAAAGDRRAPSAGGDRARSHAGRQGRGARDGAWHDRGRGRHVGLDERLGDKLVARDLDRLERHPEDRVAGQCATCRRDRPARRRQRRRDPRRRRHERRRGAAHRRLGRKRCLARLGRRRHDIFPPSTCFRSAAELRRPRRRPTGNGSSPPAVSRICRRR